MSMLKLISTKLTFFVVQQEPSGGCQGFQPDFSVGRTVAETATQLALDNNVNISTGSECQTRTSECSFEEMFDYVPVTCTEVQYIIPSMPSNRFPGPDKISMPIIKACLPVILGPVTDIIDSPFTTRLLENCQNYTTVEGWDHEQASNSFPLSALNAVSKWLMVF